MKATVLAADFRRAVESAHRGAAKQPSIPALSGLLLKAGDDGRLRVVASDLFTQVAASCDALTKREGAVAVSARVLLDLAKRIPGGTVHIETRGPGVAVFRWGAFELECETWSADLFPVAETAARAPDLVVGAAALEGLVSRVVPTMCRDRARPHLAAILFEVGAERLRAVTTDGHRLTVSDLPIERGGEAASFLFPEEAVGELQRLLARARKAARQGAEPAVAITVDLPAQTIRVAHAVGELSSKLRDEMFPPYARILPTSDRPRLHTSRPALIGALRRVLVSGDGPTARKRRYAKLEARPGSVELSTAADAAGAKAVEVVPATYDRADALMVGVNGSYLLDALGAIDGDEVSIGLGPSPLDPFSLRGDGSTQIIVMPARV